MSDTGSDAAGLPRFPFAASALCAASVGAAVWTWMSYSYAWDATPSDFWTDRDWSTHPVPELRWAAEHSKTKRMLCHDESWIGAYVRLRGDEWAAQAVDIFPQEDGATDPWGYPHGHVTLYDGRGLTLRVRAPDVRAALWEQACRGETIAIPASEPVTGRAKLLLPSQTSGEVYVDTTASRFTGASVAGLVVGAMGMLVFSVTLRHWLRERRRVRDAAPLESASAG